MDEPSAAMGLTSLESLEEFVTINQQNYRQYQKQLEGIPGVSLFTYEEHEKCNYQYIVLEIDESLTQLTRQHLVDVFHAENVIARRYFYPGCHRMEPYRSYFPHAGLLLPETEKLAERIIVLPTGTGVSLEDIKKICNILRLSIANSQVVKECLDKK